MARIFEIPMETSSVLLATRLQAKSGSPAVRIRQASPLEAAVVAGVLEASAESLRARGEALWTPSEVSAEAIERDVGDGLYYLGCDQAGVVGVFRLQPE